MKLASRAELEKAALEALSYIRNGGGIIPEVHKEINEYLKFHGYKPTGDQVDVIRQWICANTSNPDKDDIVLMLENNKALVNSLMLWATAHFMLIDLPGLERRNALKTVSNF